LDLATGRLETEKQKLIYLDEAYVVPKELCPKRGDIIISKSSGSLKHLGKAVYVTEDLPNFAVGGFLMILRFKDKAMAKAVFYRLLSRKFREYVAGLKGQNINNLDLEAIRRANLMIPTDREAFRVLIEAKEAELEAMKAQISKLKA
jgi:hypothetical protein